MEKSVLFRVATLTLSSVSATYAAISSSWFDWDWPSFETENPTSRPQSTLGKRVVGHPRYCVSPGT